MPRCTHISILLIGAGPLVLLASASCAQGDPMRAREAALARITAACGLPGSTLTLDAGHVRFRPPLDARYQDLDCALTRLRQSGLAPSRPMRFIGNEAPEAKAGNARAH